MCHTQRQPIELHGQFEPTEHDASLSDLFCNMTLSILCQLLIAEKKKLQIEIGYLKK